MLSTKFIFIWQRRRFWPTRNMYINFVHGRSATDGHSNNICPWHFVNATPLKFYDRIRHDGATSVAGNAYPSGAPEFTPWFLKVGLVFCVMFCRSLFVLFLFANVLSILQFTTSNFSCSYLVVLLVMTCRWACCAAILIWQNLYELWDYFRHT